jgi:hypothetical protein
MNDTSESPYIIGTGSAEEPRGLITYVGEKEQEQAPPSLLAAFLWISSQHKRDDADLEQE